MSCPAPCTVLQPDSTKAVRQSPKITRISCFSELLPAQIAMRPAWRLAEHACQVDRASMVQIIPMRRKESLRGSGPGFAQLA